MRAETTRGIAPIAVVAALSVAVLISVAGAKAGEKMRAPAPVEETVAEPAAPREYLSVADADENGIPDWQDELSRAGIDIATSTSLALETGEYDPLEGLGLSIAQNLIGSYVSMKQSGQYTPDRGEALAQTIAQQFKAPLDFKPYTIDDISIDESEASMERVLSYRADMREALAPLITSDEPELTYFASFIDSRDPYWLTKLTESALRYKTARERATAVVAPRDAATYHVRTLNAMGNYEATVDKLVRFSDEPLAVLALLRTYNEVEREMLSAFNALAHYYARAAN